MDGAYYGRYRIDNAFSQPISIRAKILCPFTMCRQSKPLRLKTGYIYTNVSAKKIKASTRRSGRIEFIGNSITCGMGNDITEIPQDKRQWYDQHNAYNSYATITAGLWTSSLCSAQYPVSVYTDVGMSIVRLCLMYTKIFISVRIAHINGILISGLRISWVLHLVPMIFRMVTEYMNANLSMLRYLFSVIFHLFRPFIVIIPKSKSYYSPARCWMEINQRNYTSCSMVLQTESTP